MVIPATGDMNLRERLLDSRMGMTCTLVVCRTHSLLLYAYSGLRQGSAAGKAVPHRRPGRGARVKCLPKHDENYMPPEAKAAVDQAQKDMTKKSLHEPKGTR